MGNQPGTLMSQQDFEGIINDTSFESHNIDGDPRSPTTDIARTPIQKMSASKVLSVTKNIDLTKECFNKFDKTPADPAINRLLSQWDPRSPTADFQRTPLGFLLKNAELMSVCDQMNNSECLNQDIAQHEKLTCEVVSEVIPKNLNDELKSLATDSYEEIEEAYDIEHDNLDFSSATLSQDASPSNKNSFSTPSPKISIIGLLETNLDYIETDLDTVKRRHKNNKIVKTELDLNRSINQSNNCKKNEDLSEKDPRSPSIGIDRTPIMIESKKDKSEIKSETEHNKLNSHLQELFKNNVKMQQRRDKVQNNSTEKNSESLLIYEDNFNDENTTVSITKVYSNNQANEGCRTPLSCMTNVENGQSKPSTPLTAKNMDLIDIKKNLSKLGTGKSKIPVRVSKTPPPETTILGIKSHQRKINQKELFKHNALKQSKKTVITCENTPPHPRKACWDHDNSVIL